MLNQVLWYSSIYSILLRRCWHLALDPWLEECWSSQATPSAMPKRNHGRNAVAGLLTTSQTFCPRFNVAGPETSSPSIHLQCVMHVPYPQRQALSVSPRMLVHAVWLLIVGPCSTQASASSSGRYFWNGIGFTIVCVTTVKLQKSMRYVNFYQIRRIRRGVCYRLPPVGG